MKKFTYILLALLALGLLAGCGSRGTQETTEPVETTDSVSLSPLPTESAEPELGITGLELYKNSRAVNENGDVFLAAALSREAMVGEKYVTGVALYDLGETSLPVVYSLEDAPNLGEYEGDAGEWGDIEQWLVSYNTETGEVENTLPLRTLTNDWEEESYIYSYQEIVGSLLWYRVIDDPSLEAVAYDGALNQVYSFQNPEGTDAYGQFSQDGSKYYICQSGTVLRYDTEAPETGAQRLNLSMTFNITSLSSLFSDSQGTQYGIIHGMAGDLYEYDGVVNLSTGEIEYLTRSSDYMLTVYGGYLLAEAYNYDSGAQDLIVCMGEEPLEFRWQGEESLSHQVLSDGTVLFYYTQEGEGSSQLYLGLYDGSTGVMLGSTHFTVDADYAWPSSVAVSQQADNELYLVVGDRQGNTLFYAWEYGGTGHELDSMEVSVYQVPETLIPEIDGAWDPASLVPGTCPEALSDLRAEADQLEAAYGVNIYISQECCNYLGGYVVMAEDDYDTVAEALELLDSQLSLYPEGFFLQFADSWITGVDIYLAGTLMGRSDGVLDYAGGFQLENDGRIVIVLDVTYPGALTASLHHEISHAIETKLNNNYETMLDETAWEALNPREDCYAYSYREETDDSLTAYIYSYGDPADAYFIDSYSLTYPGEDRARLFEYVMSPDYYWIDLDETPHLREKLDYYAQCIRAGFDSADWTEVSWENY